MTNHLPMIVGAWPEIGRDPVGCCLYRNGLDGDPRDDGVYRDTGLKRSAPAFRWPVPVASPLSVNPTLQADAMTFIRTGPEWDSGRQQ